MSEQRHHIYDDIEEWRDVPGYEGLYQVSNWGRVKSLERIVSRPNKGNRITYHEKIMRPQRNEKGYWRLPLSKNSKRKTFRVSRLIATTWVPNPENLPEVNHDDLDKDNNHCKNLSWSTRKQNMEHAFANRKIKRYKNSENKRSKSVAQYDTSGKLVKLWPSINETRREGWNFGLIARACRGERKTHKGFVWKYIPTECPQYIEVTI